MLDMYANTALHLTFLLSRSVKRLAMQYWSANSTSREQRTPGYALTSMCDMQGVWSPSGGWYPDPIHWRRNTALAILGTVVTGYFVLQHSAKLERRYNAPAHWIPSSMWAKVPQREED